MILMRIYPYFDAHCDTLYRCEQEDWDFWENPGHLDTAIWQNFRQDLQPPSNIRKETVT